MLKEANIMSLTRQENAQIRNLTHVHYAGLVLSKMVSISFIDLTCINLAVPDYRQMTMQEQKMQMKPIVRKPALCI